MPVQEIRFYLAPDGRGLVRGARSGGAGQGDRGDHAAHIRATIGFEKLGEVTDTPPKSLIRMFEPRGNPLARNLFSVLGYLQKRAGLELHVIASPA